MKALTLKPCWGGLVIWGGKSLENRGWPINFRGRIAIHQSAKLDIEEEFRARNLFEKIRGRPLEGIEEFQHWAKMCQRGVILGTVEIVGCVTHDPSPWFFGPYGFVLKDPRALVKPIPKLGKLGLWDLDEETERLVVEAGG